MKRELLPVPSPRSSRWPPRWPQALRTSPEAQLKMAKYEDCRKTPYYCPAGVLTVGIGSTSKVENREHTNSEIAERWVNDLMRAEKCTNREFNGAAAPQKVFESMTDANLTSAAPGWAGTPKMVRRCEPPSGATRRRATGKGYANG